MPPDLPDIRTKRPLLMIGIGWVEEVLFLTTATNLTTLRTLSGPRHPAIQALMLEHCGATTFSRVTLRFKDAGFALVESRQARLTMQPSEAQLKAVSDKITALFAREEYSVHALYWPRPIRCSHPHAPVFVIDAMLVHLNNLARHRSHLAAS